MTNYFENDEEKRAVWETVKTVNRLWTTDNRPEALREYFHEQMTAVCGGEAVIRKGGKVCLEGWSWFSHEARDIRFEEQTPHIELFLDGRVAVVAYFFKCSYTMNARAVTMKGRDLFTLVKEDDRWRIAADHFSAMNEG